MKIKARKRRCTNFGVQRIGKSDEDKDYKPGCTSARPTRRQSAPGALGNSKSDVTIEAACACPGCCATEAPYRVSRLHLSCLSWDSSTQSQDNGRAFVCAEHAICVVRANIKKLSQEIFAPACVMAPVCLDRHRLHARHR